MESKLGLDFKKVEYARGLAKNIADDVQAFCEQYTTVAVERTLARLMGIDGVDESDVPLPNVVVDAIKDKGVLGEGILFFIANAMIQTGLNPQQIAEKVAKGELDITKVVTRDQKQIAATLQPVIDESLTRIRTRRARSITSKPSAKAPSHTFILLWPRVTSTRMWCRPRPVPVREPTSSP